MKEGDGMAAGFDGSIRIDTKMDTNGFNAGTRAITSGLQSITHSLGGVAKAVGIAFGVGALIRFGQECIEIGSDIAEVQNVVDTAFGSMAYMVEDFADRAIDQFGMSELQAKKTASTYMAMSKGLGLAGQAAAQMSINVAGLTGDVASFYNVSQEIADTALKSIWTGETESLKQFGVVMTQANLQQFAYTQGIRKKISAMSQAELVQLRYLYVTEQLSLAQGDFAKTSSSWANQARILTERFRELMGIIGNGLIAALTPAVQFLNAVIAKLIAFANTVSAVIAALFGKKAEQKSVAAGYDSTAAAIGGAADAASDLTEATETAGAAAKKSVMAFDELNKQSDSSGASGAGGAGSVGTDMLDITPVDYSAATEVLDAIDERLLSALQEWKEAAQPTVEAFERLWAALEPLKDFAGQALIDFYEHFLKPVGMWVLGEGLPRFVDAITNGLQSVNWERLNGALVTLWDALAPFAINVGEGLLWLWENVLVPLAAWTVSEVLPLFLEGLAAVLSVLNGVIEALQPLAEWLFESFLRPLAEWTGGTIVALLGAVVDALWLFSDWISQNETLIQGITITVGAFFAAWKAAEILSFIQQAGGLVNCLVMLKNALVSVTLAKAADKLETIALTLMYAGDFVASIGKSVAALVSSAAAFAAHTASVAAGTAAQAALTVATTAWNAVCAAATAVTTAFSAAIAFLTSPIGLVVVAVTALIAVIVLLATHWDEVKAAGAAAWESIKSVWSTASGWFTNTVITPIKTAFKNAINFLIGLAEGFANGFIKGTNGIINALNKISITIPSWIPEIGGNRFGINIPKVSTISIPRLATGAVIPPNQQFAAILGDQTHGRNLEAPEGLIRQIFREENDTDELLFVLRDILTAIKSGQVLMVDRKVLGEIVTAEQTAAARRSGKTPIPV